MHNYSTDSAIKQSKGVEAPRSIGQSGKASLKTPELNLNKETKTVMRGYRVREC